MPSTPAKPVLIFVPGIGVTGRSYELLLRRLRGDYDVRVAMHSLDVPERPDWPFFFRAIDAATRDVESFVLLGHSMGGAICLAYAARHPQRVTRVVAVAPPTTPNRRLPLQGLAKSHLYRLLKNFVMGLLTGHPGHALAVARDRSAVMQGDRPRRLYTWVHTVDLQADLPKLQRAQVLWAKQEEVLYGDHLHLLQQFPNVPVTMIPASHNNMALNPRPIFKCVQEALRG